MSKGTRTCKVCGKEYEYCKTFSPKGTFRWQDVACSPEHGSIYLERISASRAKKTSKDEEGKPSTVSEPKKVVEEIPVEVNQGAISETSIVSDGDDFITSATESEIFEPQEPNEVSEWINEDDNDWFDDEDEDEDDWFFDDEDEWLDDDEDSDEEDTFIFGCDWPDEC